MRKALLCLAAVFFTLAGMQAGAKADAAVPEFPNCISTVIDSATTRYWLDPGNLVVRIRSVQIDGVELSRRRDGIWVGDAKPVEAKQRPYVYFTYNHSSTRGAWVACRKPSPR